MKQYYGSHWPAVIGLRERFLQASGGLKWRDPETHNLFSGMVLWGLKLNNYQYSMGVPYYNYNYSILPKTLL